MKHRKGDFIIPFEGLKVGMHNYEMQITDAFFENMEYSIVESGDIAVELELEKKETMLVANFVIDGNANVLCNRCNDPLEEYIYGEYRIVFKFGDEVSTDENLAILEPKTYELDITNYLYELITISLPTRSVHDDGECNEEMLDLLNKYTGSGAEANERLSLKRRDEEEEDNDDEIDPRWAALKGL